MIDKVGAIIIEEKKMLIVREKNLDVFFIPGGKRKGNESNEAALRREIMEELGVEIKSMEFYKNFTAQASTENDKVTVISYFCETNDEPEPSGEIEEILWIDRNNYKKINLGNVLKIMIPELIKNGFL